MKVYKATKTADKIEIITERDKPPVVIECDKIKNGLLNSEGYIVASDSEFVYIPIDAPPTKAILENIVEIVNSIAQSISTMPAVNGSPIDPAITTTIQKNLMEINEFINNLE
jgi:hypothetical protein